MMIPQPHPDHACPAWHPNLKKKLQTSQNRCIRHCLQLDNKSQIGLKHFEKTNSLPISERFNQYFCSNPFKFLTGLFLYFNGISRQSAQNQVNTRSSVLKLKHPLRNTCSGQKKFVVSDTNSLEQFAEGPEVGEFI